MKGICGACDCFSNLMNEAYGCCELHGIDVHFTDDLDCDNFSLDDNVIAFLIKSFEEKKYRTDRIYFKV